MRFVPVAVALLAVVLISLCTAEDGLWREGGLSAKQAEPTPEPVADDPFVTVLARETGADTAALTALLLKGYGRSEMVRVALIARQGGVLLEEVAALHDKGDDIKTIAGMYTVPYPALKDEAARLKQAVEDVIYADDFTLQPAAGATEQHATPGE